METWWWIALGVVILLALLATLVDGAGRLAHRRDRGGRRIRSAHNPRRASRAEGRSTPETTRPTGRDAPRPGELWTAALPSTGAEASGPVGAAVAEGACLVLAVGADAVRAVPVLAPGGRPPPDGPEGLGELDGLQRADRLASDTVLTVPWTDLRQRVGLVDPVLWDQVRYLAG